MYAESGKAAQEGDYEVRLLRTIPQMPSVVVIGLSPDWQEDGSKPLRHIRLDNRIQFDAISDVASLAEADAKAFQARDNGAPVHELSAVVVHDGIERESGHYFAFRRNPAPVNERFARIAMPCICNAFLVGLRGRCWMTRR